MRITTEGKMAMTMLNPPHPGRVLKDFPGDMTVSEAARRLRVSRANLSNILNQKAGISASMSLRLSAALGTSPDLWFKLQTKHEMAQALKKNQPKIKPFRESQFHKVSA